MRLHGNAALSLKKRQLLAGRVVEEGWSLTQAAAAAEVSERRTTISDPTAPSAASRPQLDSPS
jgi:leucine-zipper of insertion element IS481